MAVVVAVAVVAVVALLGRGELVVAVGLAAALVALAWRALVVAGSPLEPASGWFMLKRVRLDFARGDGFEMFDGDILIHSAGPVDKLLISDPMICG